MATTPLSQAVLQGMDPNVYRPLGYMQTGNELFAQGSDGSPTSKWGAIGRLAQALSGTYLQNSATSDLAKTIAGGKKQSLDDILSAIGGRSSSVPSAAPAMAPSSPAPAPSPQTAPASPPIAPDPGSPNAQVAARFPAEMSPGSAASPLPNNASSPLDTAQYPAGPAGGPSEQAAANPVAGIAAAAQPRGIRNNNPLNIEDGAFAKSQAGYAGSDGRFAKFAAPEHGVAAASSLLDTYDKKHGLNTVAGIVNRWAPPGDGNNTMAYAADVAGKLGLDPNAPVPPEMRPQLIAAMAQHENGKAAPGTVAAPVQLASAAPATANDADPELPANAAPTAGQQVAQAGSPDIHKLMAVMQNPYADDATKALASKLIMQQLGPSEFGVIGEDAMTGAKKYGWINSSRETVSGLSGKPEDGSSSLSGIDSTRTGEDYLKQFPAEIQTQVKDYLAGNRMPTGNPRRTDIVKQVASKYGNDIGVPATDAAFSEKRKMMTDLGSSSPNSMGGILSNGKSAFAHLADASDRMAANGNYSGPNVPGGAAVAHIGNFVSNAVAPTPDTEAKLTGIKDNLLKYGQEATKFYAGSGGGEAERMNALKTMDPVNSSGKQQAEFLDTEKGLMLDRITQKENQIRGTLGQDYLDKHPVRTPDLADAVKRIDANIARLRGEAPAAAAGASSSAAPAAGAPDRAAIEAEMRKRGLLQ